MPVYQIFALVISVAGVVVPLVFSVNEVRLKGLALPVVTIWIPMICWFVVLVKILDVTACVVVLEVHCQQLLWDQV